jgi:hypothetical protein
MNARQPTFIHRLLFSFCTLSLLAAPAAFAQGGRGGLSGLVSDPSGAAVPAAKVTLLNHATGVEQSTVTTSAGLYTFISLAPGSYRVTASANGFETTVRDNIQVTVDEVIAVNIGLRLGKVSEVVTVTETTDLASTENSTVGQLITSAEIDRVPLLYRNVYDLIQLSAGVTPANGSPNSSDSFAIENISSGRPGVDVSSDTINGAIVGSVYYMLDGSPLGIAENNAAAIIPAMNIPEDGVDEVRVETQNTPASFQSGGAGVISLVSKTGGDKFHGDAFGVFRPDILAANEYFNKQSQISSGQPNTPPSFHRYQEGGAIGGPILRKKLFFFADYEDTQQELYDGSNLFTVPTTAEKSGDFSADPFTIYNPLVPDYSKGPLAGTRQPFAHNKITTINPIGQKFLSEMPKCNYPNPSTCDTSSDDLTTNFFMPGLDPTTAHRFDIRMDWVQSERQRIFGRFSFDRLFNSLFNAFGNMWDLNYAQNITNGRNFLLADDLTLSPTLVLNLRYSFTRHYENQGGDPRQNGFDITSLGFPASLAAQEVYKLLPFVTFNDAGNGVGGTADYNTFQYASENSDANATLTKVFGKHEVSAGFEYMKRFMNVGQPPAPSGSYAFDISPTDQQTSPASGITVGGSDFASLLIGMGTAPGTESNSYPNFTKDLFEAEANPYYAAFVEDAYHPAKSFTVTAGLRWDIFAGRTERHNRLEYFDPTAANTSNGVSYTGAEIYVNGSNRSPFTTNMKDFGPRLGFSWQAEKRLLIRGGAGYYYGPGTHMVAGVAQDSDGFSTSTLWNATCLNGDGNTVINGTSACAGAALGSPAPSVTGIYSLSNPFPNGVVQVLSNPSGLANNLGISLSTVLHSQRTPTVYNYNFGIEYEFPHEFVFSAGYVGSRGLFLPFGGVDLNVLDLATIGRYQSALINTMVPNKWAAIQPQTNANYHLPTVPLFVALQPFPQFGNGSYGSGNGVNVHGNPAGDSDYSSLQTKVQKKLTHGFTTLVTFTWAKLITDDGNPPLGFVGSHAGAAQDWRNLNLEHSVSPQDVKYQFTAEASYDLPVGRDKAVSLNGVSNAVLGGWTVNGILYLSDGIPIASPTVGASFSYFNQRTNLVCNPSKGALHKPGQLISGGGIANDSGWFRHDCFVTPVTPGGTPDYFVPGTAPAYLDNVRTMGADELDLSLYKSFSFGEDRDLRFDVSSYNVANRPQFGVPGVSSPTQGYPNFGWIQTTSNLPRQFQFGARFTF